MKKEELIMLLQDIVEETSELVYLKKFYTQKRENNLDKIKEVVKYGLNTGLFELYRHEETEQEFIITSTKISDINECLKIVENNSMWNKADYYLNFVNKMKYYWILFGPYGPVGEHAFEGAKIPDEFTQFIID